MDRKEEVNTMKTINNLNYNKHIAENIKNTTFKINIYSLLLEG